MSSRTESRTASLDQIPILVSLLGLLIAVLPLLLLPSSSGALLFPVLIMKFLGVVVGVGVAGTGFYSHRTGNLRPALFTGSAVVGLLVVGIVGGLVEWTGGPLVPIWLWILSAVFAMGIAVAVANSLFNKETA